MLHSFQVREPRVLMGLSTSISMPSLGSQMRMCTLTLHHLHANVDRAPHIVIYCTNHQSPSAADSAACAQPSLPNHPFTTYSHSCHFSHLMAYTLRNVSSIHPISPTPTSKPGFCFHSNASGLQGCQIGREI